MTRTLSLLAFAAVAPAAHAFLVIDTFEQGYHKATITGRGNKANLATGLDREKVFAGHRYTNYTASPGVGQEDYVSTFEVGLGEARVTTPGPRDMSTELSVRYGTGFFEPMNLDLSWFQGGGRMFEVDLGTDPPDLFAEVWRVQLTDGLGRIVANGSFGTRPGGIEFRKDGFVGDPDFDWSDVDEFVFRQRWNAQNTAPFVYWTTEIRAVPEPGTLLAAGLGLASALTGRRSRRCARPSATRRP